MSIDELRKLTLPPSPEPEVKRRFSVTSDILSFQRCARQYGFFAVKGYQPAHEVQIYYGTLIHQVLDRAHAHYKGLIDRSTQGQIPREEEIEHYFNEVDSTLRTRGIKPVGSRERETALMRLKKFNEIEGPRLYPRVRDTEHRLQSDRGDFLLHGTVDVLADDPNAFEGMATEIWDYKGGEAPANAFGTKFNRYEFQMLVYCELYRQRNGILPHKAVLYFLGELDESQFERPSSALLEIPIARKRIDTALEEFEGTVRSIQDCIENDRWLPPTSKHEAPGKETCDICDIRWSCPLMHDDYAMRYP